MTQINYDGDYTVMSLDGDLGIETDYSGEFGVFQKISDANAYTGQTVVIPSQETQVLNTIGKVLGDNITVQPIPNNYGLITWNGSFITVS